MDLHGLFSASGRYSRVKFWLSWLGLVGVSVFATWLPGFLVFAVVVPGVKAALGLFTFASTFIIFYCQVCNATKRLHDMGRSGWLQSIPMAICAVIGVGAGTAANIAHAPILVDLALPATLIVGLAFHVWIGTTPSQKETNRFGAPTGRLAAAEAFA
ncbi:MAG: hypothetical protein JWM33_1179 [Caulobacteraceae bacterium]|nr:hypothetical protein [Caulobacteraceae bacterium]